MMRSQVVTSSNLEHAQSLGSAIPPNPSLSTAPCLPRAGQSPRSSCWCRGGWGRLQTSPGSEQVQGGRTDRTHFKYSDPLPCSWPKQSLRAAGTVFLLTVMHPHKWSLSSAQGLSVALKLHILYLQHLLCQTPKRAENTLAN